ncbi:MAG: hypothetical protein ACOXZS_04890 [Bacilli bacterium]|jgi:hypothetical protein
MKKYLGISLIASSLLLVIVVVMGALGDGNYTLLYHLIENSDVNHKIIWLVEILFYLANSILLFGGVLALVDYEQIMTKRTRYIFIGLSIIGILNIFMRRLSYLFLYLDLATTLGIIYLILYIMAYIIIILTISWSWWLYRLSSLINYKFYSLFSLMAVTMIISCKLIAILYMYLLIPSIALLFEHMVIWSFLIWLYITGLLVYKDNTNIL